MTCSKKDYFEEMFNNKKNDEQTNNATLKKGGRYRKKVKSALNRAHDIRKFEIELLWKRATYAAIFQTLLFAALGLSFYSGTTILIDAEPTSIDELTKTKPISSIFRFIICIAGMFTSFYWCLINIGSKFWHENWTHHIDFLEDEFDGNLHKTVLHDEGKVPFSVSRVNML